jgi:hypothetical protein
MVGDLGRGGEEREVRSTIDETALCYVLRFGDLYTPPVGFFNLWDGEFGH